ncbi:MAG: YlbF family regulator [Longimicrobiales bacterium]
MHEPILEKATELGRMLGQIEEYKALQRSRSRVNEDRDAVALINKLGELEAEVSRSLQRGEPPPEETQQAYEQAFSELQASAVYQGLVAAQTNFDKVLGRVNEQIGRGMDAGSQSRIILPS